MLKLDASDKTQVFAQVAGLAEREHQVRSELVFQGLQEREALDSTALGEGVAIPHARVGGLRRPMAMFARLKAALPFDAPDGKPVSILIVLLMPADGMAAHLQLLAEAAEMLCDDGFREQLQEAPDAHRVLQIFRTFDGRSRR